ncbi:MAG: P-II family nitrogen regulator [Gammaproteobacteria bacterium]|nr:P-II family nitrogen regulator [Gammaproteobacteria bacterium]
MKNLSIVIHASAQQTLADNLRALEQVTGFTFSPVEGHSEFSEEDPFLSAQDKVVGYIPRVRVDILLKDEDVNQVITAITGQNSLSGQGIYWVSPVEQQGRL